MVGVTGIGWVDATSYGCARAGLSEAHRGLQGLAAADGRFASLPKNFGRFEPVSRLTFFAVALAMEDAGWHAGVHPADAGIVATNRDGCLRANEAYFRDYVDCGRKLGRGNLFIYTLPSSPAAEAAIHFGFQGPLLYATRDGDFETGALELAAGMVERGEAGAMLVVKADEASAVCYVVEKSAPLPAAEAAELAKKMLSR